LRQRVRKRQREELRRDIMIKKAIERPKKVEL
jgi:hypothetical protein